MNTLALVVVLSQVSTNSSLFTEQPAQVEPAVQGGRGWLIATPIAAAIGGAFGGRRLAIEATRGADSPQSAQLLGTFAGSLVGLGAGFAAGYFARQGSVAARIASVALSLLATAAVGYEATVFKYEWDHAGAGSRSGDRNVSLRKAQRRFATLAA